METMPEGLLRPDLLHLASRFSSLMKKLGWRFACAESCTGGLLAATITELPGASDFFWGSIVSYSERAKMDILGVDPGTLSRCGAVSRETAVAMLRGISRLSSADLTISITGYAGPGGGESDKPVGTVWIGMFPSLGEPEARGFLFPGDRSDIRMASTSAAISMVLDKFSD